MAEKNKKNSLTTSHKRLMVLKEIFQKEDSSQSKHAMSLIDETIFCERTLKKLKTKINKDGPVTEMCQGKYNIERENPALKSYNTTIKNYQNLLKQISELLPIDVENYNRQKNMQDDDFDDWNDET